MSLSLVDVAKKCRHRSGLQQLERARLRRVIDLNRYLELFVEKFRPDHIILKIFTWST